MATGERTFNVGDYQVTKFERTPIPPGDYSLKLLADTVAIDKRPEPGKMPYVKAAFEALDTGKDGGRNRKVYHLFFLSMKPGKDGKLQVQRADQLVGFFRAVGEQPQFNVIDVPDEEGLPLPCTDPRAVKAWLVEHDGLVLQARIRIQRDKEYGASNKIDEFIEGTASPMTESWEDTPTADAAPEVEEEEAPAPAPIRRAAPPPVKNGATKPKAHARR